MMRPMVRSGLSPIAERLRPRHVWLRHAELGRFGSLVGSLREYPISLDKGPQSSNSGAVARRDQRNTQFLGTAPIVGSIGHALLTCPGLVPHKALDIISRSLSARSPTLRDKTIITRT